MHDDASLEVVVVKPFVFCFFIIYYKSKLYLVLLTYRMSVKQDIWIPIVCVFGVGVVIAIKYSISTKPYSMPSYVDDNDNWTYNGWTNDATTNSTDNVTTETVANPATKTGAERITWVENIYHGRLPRRPTDKTLVPDHSNDSNEISGGARRPRYRKSRSRRRRNRRQSCRRR